MSVYRLLGTFRFEEEYTTEHKYIFLKDNIIFSIVFFQEFCCTDLFFHPVKSCRQIILISFTSCLQSEDGIEQLGGSFSSIFPLFPLKLLQLYSRRSCPQQLGKTQHTATALLLLNIFQGGSNNRSDVRSDYPCIVQWDSLYCPHWSLQVRFAYCTCTFVKKDCIIERENGKSLLRRWCPFTFPSFAQITDKYNFLCFVFQTRPQQLHIKDHAYSKGCSNSQMAVSIQHDYQKKTITQSQSTIYTLYNLWCCMLAFLCNPQQ